MTIDRFRRRIRTSIICAAIVAAGTAHADQINWVAPVPQEDDTFEIISIVTNGETITGQFDAITPAAYLAQYGADTVTIRYLGPCPQDFDDSNSVGFPDLASLLAQWGGTCPPACQWDLDGNGTIGFGDLSSLLVAWGTCP